jgi:hypothetical protein
LVGAWLLDNPAFPTALFAIATDDIVTPAQAGVGKTERAGLGTAESGTGADPRIVAIAALLAAAAGSGHTPLVACALVPAAAAMVAKHLLIDARAIATIWPVGVNAAQPAAATVVRVGGDVDARAVAARHLRSDAGCVAVVDAFVVARAGAFALDLSRGALALAGVRV